MRSIDYRQIYLALRFIKKYGALPIGPSRCIPSTRFPHLLMADTDLLYLEQARAKNACFIHIPKCGGTSVKSALGLQLKDHPLLCDMIEAGLPPGITKVTVVRNPYDRLISAYEHLRKGKKLNRAFKSLILDHYSGFDDFVLNWLSHENIYNWIHFLPQTEFVTLNGELATDFTFKLETISQDWNTLAAIFGSRIELDVENPSKRQSTGDYYKNPRVQEKVASLYEADFNNFDYLPDRVF